MQHDGTRWRMSPRALADSTGDIGSALAVLSESDQTLATRFEAEGGLALCLSSAFKLTDELREQARQTLREAADSPGGLDVDALQDGLETGRPAGPAEHVIALLRAAEQSEEREAILRNVWSDVEFQAGDAGNAELVARLEHQFAGQLVRTAVRAEGEAPATESIAAAVADELAAGDDDDDGDTQPFGLALCQPESVSLLRDLSPADIKATLSLPRNLGVALDLVGVYLKNYEIDKAKDVIERVEPLCRVRGGIWLTKALDKLSAVRMKQFRAQDAMLAMKEIEALVPFAPEEGWEFHEILFRNLALCYSSLDNPQLCLEYCRKSIEVKREAGVAASWFDLWDLGKAHARIGQIDGQREEMKAGFDLCGRAAELITAAEPTDVIMRAKILSNVGEIALGIGDHHKQAGEKAEARAWHERAEEPLREAYNLHVTALGPMKPLSGWQAGTVAHCLVRLERWPEARDYLAQALRVECAKDSTTPGSVLELLERVVAVHERLKDSAGLASYTSDLDGVLADLRGRGWHRRERDLWASLLQRVATARLSSNVEGDNSGSLSAALALLREAEVSLVSHIGGAPEPPRKFGPPVDALALLQQVRSSVKILGLGEAALAGRDVDPGAAFAGPGTPRRFMEHRPPTFPLDGDTR